MLLGQEFMKNFDPTAAGFLIVNNAIIIVVRGEPLGNEEYWRTRQNILVPYSQIDGVKIDQEFKIRFESIKKKFERFHHSQLRNEAIEYVIGIGHGSGGVYVLLGMLELIALNIKQKLNVFTYGQPRVGNRQFAYYVNSLVNKITIHRITNMDDYVPRLPPRVSKSLYTHTLLENWIEDDCLCTTQKVFACAGSKIKNFFEESPECNNQYTTSNYAAHNGPYVGMMMQCPTQNFPWMTL
ncbi:hypothetical protein G9A89_007686 [Geosiphon pyriformis]|nr:hypothetical protein G9A89_007686 [Geosiphon pyriformis]